MSLPSNSVAPAIGEGQYQAEIQRLQLELQRSVAAAAEAQAAAAAAVAAHAAAAPAAAPAAAAASLSSLVKPQPPRSFSGAVGAGAEQWLMELERWRQAVEIRGPMPDSAFLTVVATYLQVRTGANKRRNSVHVARLF